MKNALLKSVVLGVLVAGAMSFGTARAVTITVNPADPYLGYMNVFDLGMGYQFGSGWGIGDLNAAFIGSTIRMSPNTIGDPDPYWYTPAGGPGSVGNKIMEANLYVEPAGSLPGQAVTFNGVVISNNLAASHVCQAFIRDFAPDFSSSVDQFVVLPASGNFSVTLNTINDPARHVQYGFQTKGRCVWFTDVAPYGAVVVGPLVPTATSNSTWGRVKSLYR